MILFARYLHYCRTHTLRVTNIPAGMEKSGLRNLFAKHGRVIDVMYQESE